MLEGLVGLHLVPRRRVARVPAGDLRAAGVRVRREVRGARLAREIWRDAALADKLERDAADLKRRFNRDFWVDDGEYF